MKIIINAASIFKGGAEQVVNSFINECRGFPENEYHIFLCDNIREVLDTEMFEGNFYFYRLDKRPGSNLYTLYNTLKYFNDLEAVIQPDVVISTGGHGYWRPKAPLVTAFNIPHYVYPESPYFQKISIKRKLYWKLKKAIDLFLYKKSDAIIVQTDDVKQRVQKLLPNIQVYTVSNTINGVFTDPIKVGNKLAERNGKETRLLTVSANYPHKNLEIIKSVIPELLDRGIDSIKFILTLPEDDFLDTFGDSKYHAYVLNVGPIPIEECPALYEECDFMFLPTLLECFSASYVEAMYMNKPILTSNLAFAKAVCKKAAIYFDPLNASEIANKIQKVILDSHIQQSLIKEGQKTLSQFNTPKERAGRFLSICRAVSDINFACKNEEYVY
jgi:glycosyltransferase involved in cell wall biosynthesis